MSDIRENIIYKLLKNVPKNADDFSSILRGEMRGRKSGEDLSRKIDLLRVYHAMLAKGKIKKSPALETLLIKRAVRTLSGVAIVTVLTEPHECPGQCVYCPDEKEMPKSYISDEPAAARALSLQFDPYRQVSERIKTLAKNGHPTDKIELIVKGGTWNAYPLEYQYWFVSQCFNAANGTRRSVILNEAQRSEESLVASLKGSLPTGRQASSNAQDDNTTFARLRTALLKAQKKNETAKHRIVGLTLETRPDHVNEKNILIMRELGCTRIELGAQTTDDKILKLVKRGHDTAETKRATKLLKNYGFKVDFHLMPQLPGSTPTKDAKMLAEIFDNPDYRPDMIKIYPCTAVKHSPLYKWVKSGKYKPYADKKLIELLINFKTIVPRYARISRLIRDIPGHHIVAGNTMTNLRQVIQREMAKRGLRCKCLRCREVGHASVLSFPHPLREYKLRRESSRVKLFIDKYTASGGTEYFLSYEDAKRQVVYAFCRLRICSPVILNEVKDPLSRDVSPKQTSRDSSVAPLPQNDKRTAFIRELHTYGQMQTLKHENIKTLKQKNKVQHTGFGKKLIIEAEKICRKDKLPKLAVISGVGVRDYYRKLGYKLEGTYMVKDLTK